VTKKVKVVLWLDDGLVDRIDQEARARGLSRSAYFAKIAERDVQGCGGSVAANLRRLDALFRDTPHGDATLLIRKDRDRH